MPPEIAATTGGSSGPHLHFEVPGGGILRVDQEQRVVALRVAREVTQTRTSSGPLSVAGTEVDAVDLVSVADWIVTGNDPWAEQADAEAEGGCCRG